MSHPTTKSPTDGPEGLFKRGLEALAVGKAAEASNLFHRAILVERNQGTITRQLRYASYFAFSKSKAYGPTAETIRLCEEAADGDIDPTLLLNLVRVYLLAGLKTKALATLEKGLRQYPNNRRFFDLRERIDRRAKPTIRYLGRDHPVNRVLARVLS
jgi:tetratricopeptide (TPR) repeat protein